MIECWLVDKPQKQKKTMNDFQFLEEDICAVFENKLYFLNSHNVKSLLSFYPPPKQVTIQLLQLFCVNLWNYKKTCGRNYDEMSKNK